MPDQPVSKCHCGKLLHYSDPSMQELVEDAIQARGEFLRVTVGGRTWLVQRHYVALHGLRAQDVPRLGFQEVTEKTATA